MYVTGRWVSENVVGTMFIAWIIGVIVFAAIILWQRRTHRKNKPNNGARPHGSRSPNRRGRRNR